ncbi:MAG: GNAT family N-acetyltransferase, partial [Eggerthellaceae bacterium]|nr:GNAT family N-acetyltransferase [Eggerthellaceae bacterium]
MEIEIRDLDKKDYGKAIEFASKGMHFDWYTDSKMLLKIYGQYCWNLHLCHSTQVLGAYSGDRFLGMLLADMEGEPKRYGSFLRRAYVKVIDSLQNIIAGKGIDTYSAANREMFAEYTENFRPEGEIVFFASDPDSGIKGVGSALLK